LKKGSYYAAKHLAKSTEWQTIEIGLEDLIPVDERSPKGLRTWQYMTQLGIVAMVRVRKNGTPVVLAGGAWPTTRKFKNMRWVGGEFPKDFIIPGRKISHDEIHKIFHEKIGGANR
ncbi:MAG: hypothetical protein VB878_20035, partial [Pirellulaceae bacterium]